MNRAPSHILVVDDDDRIRDLTRRYLQGLGYHVSAAEDGMRARHLLDQLVFDLVILDVMMPRMDGFELLKSIRATDQTTPVILLTARGDSADRIEGLKIGADDYVPKPFEPEELALRARAPAPTVRLMCRSRACAERSSQTRKNRSISRPCAGSVTA